MSDDHETSAPGTSPQGAERTGNGPDNGDRQAPSVDQSGLAGPAPRTPAPFGGLPDVDAAYSAAASKRWQLEREIADSEASRGERSNMQHTLSKLWIFFGDTCDAYERALDRLTKKSAPVQYEGPACSTCGSDARPLPGTAAYLADNAVRSMLREIAELRVIASAAISLADAIHRDERTDEEQEEIVRVVDKWRSTADGRRAASAPHPDVDDEASPPISEGQR